MSNSPKRPYDVMWPIAHDLVQRLRPYCQRIEIAGSLRRGKAEIGDIEIMAIPCPVRVRFDGLIKSPYQLDWVLEERVRQQRIVLVRNGPRQKSFHFNLKDVGQVDVELWLQPDPQTWGCNFMIRTGSADFSKWMVTSQGWGGAMPMGLRFAEGRLWQGDVALPTPEEADVFDALGLAWIPPQERKAGRWGQ